MSILGMSYRDMEKALSHHTTLTDETEAEARLLFRVPIGPISPKQRDITKSHLVCIRYGMGTKRMKQILGGGSK